MPSTRVVFFRHAQSEFNARHLIQGQLDPPLDETGLEQVALAAPRAAAAHDDAVAVFSSDLRRASVTGRAIADALDLALIEDANLRERHLGDLQGLERASLATSVPSAFKVWKSRDRNAAVPGGGESSAGVDARLSAFFQTVSTGNYAGKKIIAVTHGGVLGRLFAGGANREEKRLCQMRRGVGNFAECVVDACDDGTWRCHYSGWASGRFLEDSEATLQADDVA